MRPARELSVPLAYKGGEMLLSEIINWYPRALPFSTPK